MNSEYNPATTARVSTEADQIRAVYESRDSERARASWSYMWSPRNPRAVYYRHALELALVGALNKLGVDLANSDVLDVGCGTGVHLRFLAELGAIPERLHGVDLVPERIEVARQRSPAMDLHVNNATTVPFPDASFGVVTQFTCLSSIPTSQSRREVAAEMHRVLSADGRIVWFDMAWGPGGQHYQPISPAEIRSLFPGLRMLLERPMLHRWTSQLLQRPELCALVERLPLPKTNLLAVLG